MQIKIKFFFFWRLLMMCNFFKTECKKCLVGGYFSIYGRAKNDSVRLSLNCIL